MNESIPNYRQHAGSFTINRHIIEEHPSTVIEIFAALKFIPIRAEMMYHMDAIEYQGYSTSFEKVPNGHVPPRYEIILEEVIEENQFRAIKFKGVEKQ